MREARSVTVTTLVDNYATTHLSNTEHIKRWESGKDPVMAEHGLALLVEVENQEGSPRCFMLDTGASGTALLYNMDRMKLDPRKAEFLVISHGHWDHTGSVIPLLQRLGKKLPVFVHPEAFRERWKVFPDGRRAGPRQINRQQWEKAGAEITLTRDAQELLPECLVTGEVPRKNSVEKTPASAYFRDGEDLAPDRIPDDQALVLSLKDRGLVILAGCAHAGIINTIHRAREITGVERIWAVIGGFHLGESDKERIQWTIDEMRAVAPRLVVPSHCTGFEAQATFAQQMPDTFVLSSVGTTFHLV